MITEKKGPSAQRPHLFRKEYLTPDGEVRHHSWGFHNEHISSYEESFAKVLEGKSIGDLIRGRQNPVVVDLMAPPRTLRDLLEPFPTGRGLAVSLPDHDNRGWQDRVLPAYRTKNVKWLPGDVTHPNTWVEIEKWLRGDKAHLILERGIGGLDLLPRRPLLFRRIVNRAWSNLDPNGGVMLFETPNRDVLLRLGVDLSLWVDGLRRAGDVRYDAGDPHNIDPRMETGKILITKTPESPEALPLI